MRFVVFECRKCGHLLYVENTEDVVKEIGRVSNSDCPNCGEEPDGNWALVGLRNTLSRKESTMGEEKQIDKERWDIAKIMADNFHINGEGFDESDFEWTAHCLQMEGYHRQSDVIEEYRQRVNIKMGKHTHLLGKEYVQRILREVAREMKGGAE